MNKYSVKSTVCLDVTPCSLVWAYGGYRRTYCLHFQFRRVGWTRKDASRVMCLLLAECSISCLTYTSTLRMEVVHSSETSISIKPHGNTSQRIVKFIVTVLETSNLGNGVRSPAEARYISLLHSVQSAAGSNPVSYRVGAEGCFLGGKVGRGSEAYHSLLLPRLGMHGAMHSFHWF
jgi:hypothetical protein